MGAHVWQEGDENINGRSRCRRKGIMETDLLFRPKDLLQEAVKFNF
jgi:hypothetical protein